MAGTTCTSELAAAAAALSFAVLVLATIVCIIFVFYCRGTLFFRTHDEERRFKGSTTALSTHSNSFKTNQQHLLGKSFVHNGEYVNFEAADTKAIQTEFDAVSIGRNFGKHLSNKSDNIHGNTTSDTNGDGIRSAQASRTNFSKLLSQKGSAKDAKGLSYSFVDVTMNKDGAQFTYDKAKAFPDNHDKPTDPMQTQDQVSTLDTEVHSPGMYGVTHPERPAFEENMYDRTKGRNETYDITYQRDHVAISANSYDHIKALAGTGRLWNLKQNTMK